MAAEKGNQYAAKDRMWARAIQRALEKRSAVDRKDALEAIAETMIEQALQGDKDARKEIGDRLDGKPHQTATVEHVKSHKEMTTDELLALIAAERAASTEKGTGEPRELH